MAKKQVPKNIQEKFDKPLFKSGDAVFFSWLGQKQYGYVTKTKKSSWGIQYTVQNSEKRNYPCGIQIAGHRTQYDVGFIFFDETKKLSRQELETRINAPRTFTAISIDAGRTTNQSSDGVGLGGVNIGNNDTKIKQSRGKSRSSSKNDDNVSNTRMPDANTKKRKNSATDLDSAIQRQRDFLNGFVKKD
jgi:hypothetical protein